MQSLTDKRPRKCKLKFVLLSIVAIMILLSVGIFYASNENTSMENEELIYSVYGDFLIDGPNCKIPNLNPFAKEAMEIFKREDFEACSQDKPLTSVEQNFEDDLVRLIIHDERFPDYLSWWQTDIHCCYQNIIRAGYDKSTDDEFRLSTCKMFNSKDYLEPEEEFILVTCSGYQKLFSWKPSSVVYKNAHAIVRTKEKVKQKLETNSIDKTSVFLMGIDSISRLNLIRGLPKTYEYLEVNEWFELRGYNKMGDNTLPNLMAILTGQNESLSQKICNYYKVGGLENCQFLWKNYESAGYVTAYVEDETSINTFNYHKPGFIKQPTDYYLRPFALAIEQHLNVQEKHNRRMCVGYQHYADFIYQFGLDFAVKYMNQPYFGLFWTNSFSHEDLSMSSAMDDRVKYYLMQLELLGILESSIVIFFSDHGMRFGAIRKLFTGFIEERLPFFYISLPEKFKRKHPKIVENLKINRDRLTSPYDVYVTLKQILQISGGYDGDLSAVSCPKCQSLFQEIPHNRTCADAGVDKHWCTYVDFKVIDKSSTIVKSAASFVVDKVNADLTHHVKCAELKLNEIYSARKSTHTSSTDYLISFDVKPSKAQLEATVRCNNDCESFEIIGSVSRLNRYGEQSWCVNDTTLKLYCYCN